MNFGSRKCIYIRVSKVQLLSIPVFRLYITQIMQLYAQKCNFTYTTPQPDNLPLNTGKDDQETVVTSAAPT